MTLLHTRNRCIPIGVLHYTPFCVAVRFLAVLPLCCCPSCFRRSCGRTLRSSLKTRRNSGSSQGQSKNSSPRSSQGCLHQSSPPMSQTDPARPSLPHLSCPPALLQSYCAHCLPIVSDHRSPIIVVFVGRIVSHCSPPRTRHPEPYLHVSTFQTVPFKSCLTKVL